MENLKINPEFELFLPPLTEEEYKGLEADIKANGCRDALVIWDGVVVDGHNRLRICRAHQIDFKTVEMVFESNDAAKFWILKNQSHRRNLTAFVRAELAIQLKPFFEEQAKKRMLVGVKKDPVANLPQGKTRDKLAKIAGISPRNLSKVDYIAQHADEETKDRLRRGEKGVSINSVYNDLRERFEPKEETPEPTVQEETSAAPSNDTPQDTPQEAPGEVGPNPAYMEAIKKHVRENPDHYHYDCVNLMNIPKTQTRQLRNCLFRLFSKEYRVKLVLELMEEMVTEDGKEVISDLVKTIRKKFK